MHTLNVVTKNLAMTLGTALSETLELQEVMSRRTKATSY